MDPFEVRMQFVQVLRKLNASQTSISKAVSFALKYYKPCGEDLWDCIVEECQKGSINARINILHFLDSLCDQSIKVRTAAQVTHSTGGNEQYLDYVARDIQKIIDSVVPPGREGLPNVVSTRQILERWRSMRTIDPDNLDQIIARLSTRKREDKDREKDKEKEEKEKEKEKEKDAHSPGASRKRAQLPKNEVLRRIEEDRERHKRLRERRWVQPISFHNPGAQQLLTFMPFTEKGDGEFELSIDIEFENDWDATSDWNEDDDEACREENALCLQ